jgi:hypothetical protein
LATLLTITSGFPSTVPPKNLAIACAVNSIFNIL